VPRKLSTPTRLAVTGALIAAVAGALSRTRVGRTAPEDGPNGQLDPNVRLRADLVTDLIESFRHHAGDDRALCHRAAVARTVSMIANDPRERQQAERDLAETIRELITLARERGDIDQSIVNRLEDVNEQLTASRPL